MNIYQNINALTSYGLVTGLIHEEDIIYTQNRLLELFRLDGFESNEQASDIPPVKAEDLKNILKKLLDQAY